MRIFQNCNLLLWLLNWILKLILGLQWIKNWITQQHWWCLQTLEFVVALLKGMKCWSGFLKWGSGKMALFAVWKILSLMLSQYLAYGFPTQSPSSLATNTTYFPHSNPNQSRFTHAVNFKIISLLKFPHKLGHFCS